ncbi:MAG: NADH-quinone oxidoreductase subunit N [Bacteroidota bacterium]|nr:NADH-quinone oxidoreductase subunit N [Bacteroidota bacterium]MDP4206648.1 NADH-quinone oxidoreductase subunit N [Bacteroidota bacterium]
MAALISIAVFGIALLYIELTNSKKIQLPLAVVGLLVTLGLTVMQWNHPSSSFNNMAVTDNYSVAFNASILLSTMFVVLLSAYYYEDVKQHVAEIMALMLFTVFGAFLITSFSNMIMLFLGIETLSIPLYVLAGSKKFSLRSNEASFKYFLMGAFASAILLLGITLVYGASATFQLSAISDYVNNTKQLPGIFYMGIILILVGFSFKVAAAPFHFWTPDVYEGSPTLITAFMATVVKIAGFAAFYRLFSSAFSSIATFWEPLLWGMIILTLLISNFAALLQKGVKRLLAYSSISHAGFLLLGIIALNKLSAGGIFYYTLAYSLATIPAFGVLILVKNHRNSDDSIDAFNGLAKKNPLLAIVMSVALLSMAGIPITAGFFAKYYIFVAAIDSGYILLTIFAVLAAVLGVFYYFRLLNAMFLKEGEAEKIKIPVVFGISLLITTILTLAMGVFPDYIIKLL